MRFVSVIVPVYNTERYVGDALRSVLEQTFTDFEVIVVDDGSEDRSMEVVDSLRDPRIRIVSQRNRGLAAARNTGIRNARGAYIALLDADDLWTPRKLERHVEHLESRPHVGVSFSYSALIDASGRPLGRFQKPHPGRITPRRLLLSNPLEMARPLSCAGRRSRRSPSEIL